MKNNFAVKSCQATPFCRRMNLMTELKNQEFIHTKLVKTM